MREYMKKIIRSEKGFSLIELLIALAIAMAIIGALSGAIFQTFAGSAGNSNYMMAVRQVQNTGYWFSLDVQQSSLDNVIIDTDLYDDVVSQIIGSKLLTGAMRTEGDKL
jgi:Tfp pilus assembly protein PilW